MAAQLPERRSPSLGPITGITHSQRPDHLRFTRLRTQPTQLVFLAFCLSSVCLATVPAQAEDPASAQGEAPPQSKSEAGPQDAGTADDMTKLLEEEQKVVLREDSASIARGMYPGKPQPISDAPSNVYVISDDDIRQSGAIDIPTVLRSVPGIDVMQVTGADFNVSARGNNQLRANKMLVLVDGRSIYLDVQGEVLWKNIPVTLPEIKRIEVLKGPAGAVYGFNAFDGVINIITKSAAELKGVTLQFGGGEFGTISSAAIVGAVYGDWGLRLSAGHNQTNQWNNRDSLAFRNNLFNGQVERHFAGDAKLTLQGGIVDSNRYFGPVVDQVVVNQQPSQRYANVVYERPNFFIRAFWTGTNQPGTVTANPLLAPFLQLFDSTGNNNLNLVENSYNIEVQQAWNLWARNRLTVGSNYRYNTAKSPFIGGDGTAYETRFGLYLQDEWKITDQVTVVGGVRYDMDTFINPTISPRGAILYSPWKDHSFRAEISLGYRPPTIFETRTVNQGLINIPVPFPPFTIGIPSTFSGSPNLAPEQITSYNVGYQGWYWKHRLRTRADAFYNHISDLIGVSGEVNPAVLSLFNGGTQGELGQGGGSADIYGGEVGFEVWPRPWLSAFANASYAKIRQTYELSNRVARGAPQWKANIGARAEFDNGLSGQLLLHYVDNATYPVDPAFAFAAGPPFNGAPAPLNTVGGYFLFNPRVAYKFWREKASAGYLRDAEVAVTGFNALNDKHKEHPLGETISHRWMGWLTIRY